MKTHHVLITGGNGLVGKPLTQALLQQGHRVSHLSRQPSHIDGVTTYGWDIPKGQIDEHCLEGVDTIIHLAGADIASEPWTPERKTELISSRIESIRLLYRLMRQQTHTVHSIISASGIVYYGNRGDDLLTEQSAPATDFLATCTSQWEAAVDEGKALNLRVVKFRTGVVLTKEGGALPALAQPVQSGYGAPIGTGHQWVSWIHLQDVVGLYLLAVTNFSLEGVFNQTAPEPVTNRQLVDAIARQFNKSLWMPSTPRFLLKMIMGERSTFVLSSINARPSALLQQLYTYHYPTINGALKSIYA
ncbi:TIGR01777 family oxidoreductase [Spirosoma flavum]|uniref:TIGR01777 family oxidoreductase n=1 Tax=Spirosoma flavum TaxID=2048557 RepID=A0ABW6ASM0_9BACT